MPNTQFQNRTEVTCEIARLEKQLGKRPGETLALHKSQLGGKPGFTPRRELDATLGSLRGELELAKGKPSAANLRRVETAARKTTAALAHARRTAAAAPAPSPRGRTAAELLRLPYVEQEGLASRAAHFSESGKPVRGELHAALAAAKGPEAVALRERFASAFDSHLYLNEFPKS